MKLNFTHRQHAATESQTTATITPRTLVLTIKFYWKNPASSMTETFSSQLRATRRIFDFCFILIDVDTKTTATEHES